MWIYVLLVIEYTLKNTSWEWPFSSDFHPLRKSMMPNNCLLSCLSNQIQVSDLIFVVVHVDSAIIGTYVPPDGHFSKIVTGHTNHFLLLNWDFSRVTNHNCIIWLNCWWFVIYLLWVVPSFKTSINLHAERNLRTMRYICCTLKNISEPLLATRRRFSLVGCGGFLNLPLGTPQFSPPW